MDLFSRWRRGAASEGGWLTVGKPQVRQDAAGHTKGIKQGNESGDLERQKGFNADGTATAERSTGINADAANPIDPRMPTLTPP